MEDILILILRAIVTIIVAILLIPVIWIIATPFILVGSAFFKKPYFKTVGEAYRKTTYIWSDWGFLLL